MIPAELVKKLGPDLIILDDIGMRCMTRQQAHPLIAEKNARRAAQRVRQDRAAAEVADKTRNSVGPTRARIKALQENQPPPSGNALADMRGEYAR